MVIHGLVNFNWVIEHSNFIIAHFKDQDQVFKINNNQNFLDVCGKSADTKIIGFDIIVYRIHGQKM